MADPGHEPQHDFTCREVVEIASEYIDGALPPEHMTAFEVHLNFCDGCDAFVDQIRTTAAMARSVSDEAISGEMRAKLLTAFRDWKQA